MGAFWSAMRRMAEPLPRPLASAGKHSIRSVAHTPAARIAMSDKTKVSFMMKNNTSGASLFLLWTCGASLRITVLAVPPVISIIQQDLHLSGTENRTAIRRTGHPIRDCRNAGVDIDHPLWRSQHVANRPCDRCHWGCAAGRNFEPWQLN